MNGLRLHKKIYRNVEVSSKPDHPEYELSLPVGLAANVAQVESTEPRKPQIIGEFKNFTTTQKLLMPTTKSGGLGRAMHILIGGRTRAETVALLKGIAAWKVAIGGGKNLSKDFWAECLLYTPIDAASGIATYDAGYSPFGGNIGGGRSGVFIDKQGFAWTASLPGYRSIGFAIHARFGDLFQF